ncbi:uncharacterized protein DEA37_0011113 [Paragonimus westermani]|uniref:UspA domain-containing protein n=1 Tax=Paragonimus westermani TaxID=34504 RepID=A0A5J4P3M3_9TREM|nr:uncharacterized protein DEA37_0011113 [Paragonimus westermani]
MVTARPRRILFPVDQSDHCKRAIQWYFDKFAQKSDKIYLLHVAEPHFAKNVHCDMTADYTTELQNTMNHSVELGKQVGDSMQALFKSHGLSSQFLMYLSNKPGEQTVRVAEDKLVDMIIIGNRGVSTLRRTMFGSVSDHVIHHANIPVIIVPPPQSISN